MISSRRMTHTPSAGLARARLLRDKAQTCLVEPQHAKPITIGLSPDDQTQFAIQIAQGFKQHFLAEIVYLPDAQMVAATLKPVNPADMPHTIYVDTNGNVDVLYDFADHTGQRRTPRWMLFTLCSTIIALIVLLASALMTMI